MIKEIIGEKEKKYGADNIQIFGKKLMLAEVYFEVKKYDEAIPICQKISAEFQKRNIIPIYWSLNNKLCKCQ